MSGPFLLLHPDDNILVARSNVAEGTEIALEHQSVRLTRPIPLAHKIARYAISQGDRIFKYGMPIGVATASITPGEHVHVHNIRSAYTPTHILQDADGLSEEWRNDR